MLYKKPTRRCLFRGLKQSQLGRHIRLKHGEEAAVADSLKLIDHIDHISDHIKMRQGKKNHRINVNVRRGKSLD